MKKFKFLFLIILVVTFFTSAPSVNALDYVLTSKFGGKKSNDVFWLEPNQRIYGPYFYKKPLNSSVGDYLDVSFCSTGNVITYTLGSNIQHDPIKIDTGMWCSTGQYDGTIKHHYYLVGEWAYTDDGGYVYVEDSVNGFFYNGSSYSVQVLFYGIANISELDMSLAILAYLKSQDDQIDYTDALNQIQSNTSKYTEEIKIVQDKLNETNISINDMKEALTDSSVSNDTGSSFFDSFSTTDNGGISAIVTAPLIAIQKMTSGVCTPLSATYKGKELSLPCGNSFWADMPDVRQFLNVCLGGFLCYGILAKLYLLIDRLKDPDDDRVDVMKL